CFICFLFFFSSRRRHTRWPRDWSSDVCSSDLHPARQQARGVLMSMGAMAAVIATGSTAIAEMANLGATAWMQGYGRENEMEADRLGLTFATKAGYRPEAMGEVFRTFKAEESFEINRAKEEGREPNVY